MIPECLRPFTSAVAIFERTKDEEQRRMFAARANATQVAKLKSEEGRLLNVRAELIEADRLGLLVVQKHATGGIPVAKGGTAKIEQTVIEQRQDVERLKSIDRQIQDVRNRLAKLQADADHGLMLTTHRMTSELVRFAHVELVEVKRPDLALKKERPIDALSLFRDNRNVLIEQRATIAKAPLPPDIARQKMKMELRALAARGVPKVFDLFTGGKLGLPQVQVPSNSPVHAYVPDGISLIAFLFGKELEAKIDELIQFNASAFPNALTPDARAERLADLDKQIAAAWQLEAACVESVIEEGGTAFHSPHTPVLTALGLAVSGVDFE